MVTPYFLSIRETLLAAFKGAKLSIDIAVAWFTNEHLFNMILSQLESGVKVRLVMINDDINHCSGLDLQHFIDKGGQLFFGKTGFFMHNKYCIIDGNTVFTGSYNYTYYAEHSNFENIVCFSGEQDAVTKFSENYELILSLSDLAENLDSFLKEHPYAVNTHASTRLRNRDLYQKTIELFDEDCVVQAHEVMKTLGKESKASASFIIRDVLYKQWQPKYCIERIEVTPLGVFFDISVDASGDSFYIYGPGLDKTWHIIQDDGTFIYASAITNIKIDGVILEKTVENRTIYKYEIEGYHSEVKSIDMAHSLKPNLESVVKRGVKPKNARNLTCRLSFPQGDYVNSILDLYEGNESDKVAQNYWHFLRVNMCLNRE